jgi:hypothetical protein
MKRIVNGKTYNTETADCIEDISDPSSGNSDFRWNETYLYRTKKGAWFVAGRGNAASRWARSTDGRNGYGPGHGLNPVTDREAMEILEAHNCTDAIEQYFGEQLEEA